MAGFNFTACQACMCFSCWTGADLFRADFSLDCLDTKYPLWYRCTDYTKVDSHVILPSEAGRSSSPHRSVLPHNFVSLPFLAFALSYRFPSSACSFTDRSGSSAGMMRRG